MTIKTITTIALINFAVVVGMIIGWSYAAKSNEIRVTVQPSAGATTSANSANPFAGVPQDLLPQKIEPASSSGGQKPAGKPSPTPASVSAPAPAQDNRCIVTIQGKRYDVTQLRTTHSGGDIFACGTDMTNTFFGQHNQSLLDTTMQQYLIP